MSANRLEGDTLRLEVRDPAEVLAWIDAMSPSDRAEVSAEWVARVRRAPAADPWICGFNMVDRETGVPVGSCAYKSPPDAEGIVEIAYGVAPEHQGRGYATEGARIMVDYAFGNGIRIVRAHTLRESNASTRVLSKCGFEYRGEVVDPDDGLVWRFEIRRDAARESQG